MTLRGATVKWSMTRKKERRVYVGYEYLATDDGHSNGMKHVGVMITPSRSELPWHYYSVFTV